LILAEKKNLTSVCPLTDEEKSFPQLVFAFLSSSGKVNIPLAKGRFYPFFLTE